MKNSQERQLLSHATVIAVFSVLSKILGLLRDRFLASQFGPGWTLDAYYAAFRIPDFIFNLIVLGTVSAAFVPVFLNYVSKKRTEEAFAMANTMLNAIMVALVILATAAAIFARPLMRVIAPGFNDPEIFELAVTYMRWMLISPVIFGVSSVMSGILNAYRRFVAYSLAPVFYNLGIILGIIFFIPIFGPIALAWGVVFGAALHLLTQIPSVIKVGYHWRPEMRLRSEGFSKVVKLMIPRMIGFSALQLSLFVTIAIATTLGQGSASVYNLALNLQFFPVTIFGVSLATAVFPVLALSSSREDLDDFREHFSLAFRKILFFIIPVSVLMLLLRAQIVRVLFGSGAFDWEATIRTLNALGYFTLSLFAQALLPLLTRTFYALQNTRTPVIVGVISMVLNIGLSFVLGHLYGVSGLALSFSIANGFNALVLLLILRYQVGNLDDQRIVTSATQTLFSSLLGGVATYGGLYFFAYLLNMSSFSTSTYIGIFLQAALSGIIGLAVFLIVMYLLKSEELILYSRIFRKRYARTK